jgi:hypothetical protein
MAAAITAGAAAFVAVPALLPWAMGRREITRLRQAVAVLEDEARTPRRSAEDALRETTFARACRRAPQQTHRAAAIRTAGAASAESQPRSAYAE